MKSSIRKMMKTLMMLAAVSTATAFAQTYNCSSFPELQNAGTGNLWTNGEIADYILAPSSGNYTITVSAGGTPCAGVYPTMVLRIDTVSTNYATVTNSSNWANYSFTVNLSAGVHRVAIGFNNDAYDASSDRNLYLNTVTISPTVTRTTQAAWYTAAVAMEAATVTNTAAAIETNRKGDASILVYDQNGVPATGAVVTVEQTNHDFLFGCNFMSYQGFGDANLNATYEQKFEDVFNYATAPLYWNDMEPTQGSVNYAWYDGIVNTLTAHNIKVKGHPLLWGDPSGLPAWTNGAPTAAQMQTRVNAIVNHYMGLISVYDVVNEPLHFANIPMTPYQWVRNLDPAAKLAINDYVDFADDANTYYTYLQNTAASGVPFDAIGFQAHSPVDMAYPMMRVQQVLNTYAGLGKEIHISEFTPMSSGVPVTGATWRGSWTEQTQADYAEDFYRVCFANPAVAAISWWDFTDHGSWLPNGGLLRSDLSNKPAYDAIKNLIKSEWHTSVNGLTSVGAMNFRGFYGTYNVSVTFNGVTKTTTMHLGKGLNNQLAVNFGGVVADKTPPVITMSGSSPVTVTVKTSYSDAGASATDNVDGNVTSKIVTTNNVNINAAGTYTVVYTVSDKAGNTATATRTVNVVDNVKPVITMTGSASVSVKKGKTYTDAGAAASDNYDGNITSKITVTSTVNTAKAGTYYVTYNVKDAAGNAATSVKRTVKVS